METASRIDRDIERRTQAEIPNLLSVAQAAEILGLSERRVRAFINPQCNCVIRNRRKAKTAAMKAAKGKKIKGEKLVFKGVPDDNCPICGGTGKGPPRLPALRLDKKSYMIQRKDLTEFMSQRRLTGRPPQNLFTV